MRSTSGWSCSYTSPALKTCAPATCCILTAPQEANLAACLTATLLHGPGQAYCMPPPNPTARPSIILLHAANQPCRANPPRHRHTLCMDLPTHLNSNDQLFCVFPDPVTGLRAALTLSCACPAPPSPPASTALASLPPLLTGLVCAGPPKRGVPTLRTSPSANAPLPLSAGIAPCLCAVGALDSRAAVAPRTPAGVLCGRAPRPVQPPYRPPAALMPSASVKQHQFVPKSALSSRPLTCTPCRTEKSTVWYHGPQLASLAKLLAACAAFWSPSCCGCAYCAATNCIINQRQPS